MKVSGSTKILVDKTKNEENVLSLLEVVELVLRQCNLVYNQKKNTRRFNMVLLGGINNSKQYIIKIYRLHFPVTIFRGDTS